MTSSRKRPENHDPASTPNPTGVSAATWAVLLSRWVSFAKASLALPEDGDFGRLRESVSDIIALQAVLLALQELPSLPSAEQALGRDRAAVLLERHVDRLCRPWSGATMPHELLRLIEEAEAVKQQLNSPLDR